MLQFEEDIFQIINIYAPTNTSVRKTFYLILQNVIEKNKNTILAGDFNMIENLSLDRLGGNPNKTHTIGIQSLNKIKNNHNLEDIWRRKNPYKKHFTYHNAENSIHSRLDRIYTTKTIKAKSCNIIPTTISDHDSVSVTLQVSKKEPKGPGIWKLNTSILKHKAFEDIFNKFWKYWQEQKINYKNQNDWWDIGKLYFKTIAIDYCTKINQKLNKNYQTLMKNIIEEKSSLKPDISKIEECEQKLEEIENYKNQGKIIRSKEKIILNEEKPTKYFFSQEKQKQNKKHITHLQNEKGQTFKTTSKILKECKNFYENLYKKHNTCETTQNELLKDIPRKLKDSQNLNLIKKVQISEIRHAVFSMENDKSPGVDGLPIEFYKKFFEKIKHDLQTTYNKTLFQKQQPPKTWNQAIITLIPKKGDTRLLKYWRPISLLRTDYKILTKILANRLKQVLPEIISEEQNCSIPNRTIFNNLFLIRDIITYTKEKNNHFYLLQVDQEKAFDKIDRNFLFKTMEKMGISPIFINFIKTLYKQNTSMITNNGFLSEQIPLQRGLRQGCPLSLPLYVIQGEVTTININNNNSIKGMHIPNKTKEIKISQYADDSNLFLKNQESVNKVLQFFEKLNKATGITINLEKTRYYL